MEKIENVIDLMALFMELKEYRSRYKAVKRYVESAEYVSKETILAILGIKEKKQKERKNNGDII